MCTMTWHELHPGYRLFFNRDERRERKPALPPAVRLAGRTRFIAPLDGDFGGSWLAVNQWGLTLALLNGYSGAVEVPREPAGDFTSRGLLLTSLADSRSGELALGRLARRDLARFRSFLLATFDADGSTALASWIGGELRTEREIASRMPVVSSSFDTADVRRARRELFVRMSTEPFGSPLERHLAYHASHRPERGPRSVCMHRPNARTVSFSRIEVLPGEVRFHYVGHPPCRGLPEGEPVRLERAA